MKTYHNTFAASALLAHSQPSQEAPKIYATNQFMDNFYILSGIYIDSVHYRYLVNSMQIRRDGPAEPGDRLVGDPCIIRISALTVSTNI